MSTPMPPAVPLAERVYAVLLGLSCVATGLSHFLQQWLLFFVFVAAMALPRRSASRVPWLVPVGLASWAAAVILADVCSPLGAEVGSHGLVSLWMLLILPAILRAPQSVRRRADLWLGLLIGGMSLSMALAAWQFFAGTDPWRARPLDTAWFSPEWTRGRGLQTNPMTFSGMTALLAIAAISRVGGGKRNGLWIAGAIALFAAMSMALSRSYLVFAPAAIIGLWAAKSWRRAMLAWSAACALLVLGGVIVSATAPEQPAPAAIENRSLTVIENRPAMRISPGFERIVHWHNAWEIFCRYPITGVGQGGEMPLLDAVNPMRDTVPTRSTHNLLLRILVQTGTVGLWAFGTMVFCIARGISQARGRSDVALALAGLLALVGLFENAFFDSEIQQLFWLLLGMSAWMGASGDKNNAPRAAAQNSIMPQVMAPETTAREWKD